MKAKSCCFIIAILTVALLVPQKTHSIYTGKIKQLEPEFSPTRLIVKLKPEVDKKVVLDKVDEKVVTGVAGLDSLNAKFKVERQEKLFKEFKETAFKLDEFSSVYILNVPEGTDLKKMKEEYEKKAEVEYVELDYKVELFDKPRDPLFVHQWYLNNLGTAQNGGQGYYGINRPAGHTLVMKFGTEDADIDALEAFQIPDQNVIPLVGIIDTGVDLDHEDLAENIWTNSGEIRNNGIDDDHNGFIDDFYGWDFSGEYNVVEDNDPTDTYGHGTHCAGIVAAVRNNYVGIKGINSPCRIMSIKIFPNAYEDVAAKGIIYAADMGCDVINMSWGGPNPSKTIEDAIDYAINKGVLPVAAAGNDGDAGNPLFYPAAYPQVFSVGASNSNDQVTYWSSYGSHIEVVAPGEDILSLRADNTDMYAENGYPYTHIINEKYYLCDGTSMASPCAAGVAAYLLGASPGISKDRVVEIMTQSADDIIYPYGGDSLHSPGKDIYSGYGRVNLNSAIQLMYKKLVEIEYPHENAIVSGEVSIVGTATDADSFQNYVLEYGEGHSPTNWIGIANSTNPVIKNTLGVWNSNGLTGSYTIRLRVGEQNQAIVHVIAANVPYIKIISPIDGDTIEGFAQVYGSTITPDFSYYTLEYGRGESPSTWISIDSSTNAAVDSILGNWLVSLLGEGIYTLRLRVVTRDNQTYADSVVVFIKNIASDGWFADLPGYGSLSPTVGDMDGDGDDEIVVGVGAPPKYGKSGRIEIFSHEGQREIGWPKDTDKNMFSSPALGDLDSDRIDDIVICSQQGVHAYLSSSDDWSRSVRTRVNQYWGFATPVTVDLDNDGYSDVLIVNDSGTVYAWHNDGESIIPKSNGVFAKTVASAGEGFPCLAVADLDRDGLNEVIAAVAHANGSRGDYYGNAGGIYIWDIKGNLLLKPGDYSDSFAWVCGIAIANIDENEDLEIIVLGATGSNDTFYSLSAYKKDGIQVSGYPIILRDLVAGEWYGNHPAIGDLDGDGALEIVVTMWTPGEARIYAWHQDGTPLAPSKGPLVSMKSADSEREKEVLFGLGNNAAEIASKIKNMESDELTSLANSIFPDTVLASMPETFGSPVLADVNGDGKVDILVRAGYVLASGHEKVFAWDYEGNLIDGFPLYASARPTAGNFLPYTPVIADVDKDGKLNLILATDWLDYRLISWDFDTDYDSTKIPWPKYRHDKWNSGRYGFGGEIVNAPPSNLHVRTWDENSITLAWRSEAPWVSMGYNMYRSTVSGEPGEKINTGLIPQSDSEYQDLGLTFGQTYYYTITNVDTNYQESNHSTKIEFSIGSPSIPTGLIAGQQKCDIRVNWLPNPELESVIKYRIFRKGPRETQYNLADSVIADTTYLDTNVKTPGAHSYQIAAVNHLDLESSPSGSASVVFVSDVPPPSNLRTSSRFGTEVTLIWDKPTYTVKGYKVYRSTTPNVYNEPPINGTLIANTTYQDTGLTEGVIYYYVMSAVRVCDAGSEFSNQLEFLAGRPHPPGLKIRSSGENIKLYISSPFDTDIKAFGIYRQKNNEAFEIMDSLYLDTFYVDTSAIGGTSYYYKVIARDTLGLESFPSDSVEGCIILFSQGIILVDMTYGKARVGVKGDSVSAFYQRALEGYDYTYVDHSNGEGLTLFELSTYRIAIVHSEDEATSLSLSWDTYLLLEQYLYAGGALLIEGRNNLSGGLDYSEFVDFDAGDFRYDYLGVDSAYRAVHDDFEEATMFTGANRVPQMEGYPQIVELDTSRIDQAYTFMGFDPNGKLPGVGYFMPLDSSEVIYTFVSVYDTSASNGKPVALKHITDDFAVILFDFPFWFVKEDIATEILHKAISDLQAFTDVEENKGEPKVPTSFALSQNYPNPFNSETAIEYTLPKENQVKIVIYNMLGQKVKTLLDQTEPAGYKRIIWDGKNERGEIVSSGMYFYRIEAKSRKKTLTQTNKMLLLK